MIGRAAIFLLLMVGCQVRSREFVSLVDGGRGETRAVVDAVEPDLPPGAERPPDLINPDIPGCNPRPEQCNGLDDDCDRLVDEDFDLNTDPAHCGRCGNTCRFANAFAACSIGRCRLNGCETTFVDLDRLENNGCECGISNEGQEICDGRDNDCDGALDEGFDLDRDPMNCGICGRICQYPHAAPMCGVRMCQMGACDPGFVDLDRSSRNGCEYPCTPSNGSQEICDGKDNDCDGDTDEGDPRVGMRCFPEGMTGCDPTTGSCQGSCGFGAWACAATGLVCANAMLPKPDLCDGQDNNCDGRADEDFDLQNDPRWCGSCTKRCDYPNAVPGCSAGQCTIKFCRTGFVDLDKLMDNGCEYPCAVDGPEVCDGKDNDCDGKTDLDDSDLLYPTVNFCNQVGECGKGPGGGGRYPEPTFPACTTPPGAARPDWTCNYPSTVQLLAPNQVLGEETFCDGLDNDCDGSADEHAKVGMACTDTGLGECKKTGVFRCQADRALSSLCDVTGVPTPPASDEVCDGKDNDCDGVTDEPWDTQAGLGYPTCAGGAACRGVRDDLVHVTASGRNYYIFQYEATRVDATMDMQGSKESRACSRRPTAAGLKPWTLVTLSQATSACTAAGMRLCKVTRSVACSSAPITDDEWGLACSAGLICPNGLPRTYPYACSYDAAVCNGTDKGMDNTVATGSLAMCISPDLDVMTAGEQVASDMSGNVAEWTDDCRGTLNDGTGRRVYTLRGGSYNNLAQGLRCDFMSLAVADNFAFSDTGFRCCSSCAPGLADCSGACVSLGSDSANCGACGKACPAGSTCGNGICR